jgi:hypothetical protein
MTAHFPSRRFGPSCAPPELLFWIEGMFTTLFQPLLRTGRLERL